MATNQKVSNNLTNYSPQSNYRFYYRPLFSKSFNEVILGTAQLPRELPVSEADRRWVIEKQYDGRLDMIAYKWYGPTDYQDLMWVIMLYNNSLDPLKDFTVGTEIYIPARTTFEGRLT